MKRRNFSLAAASLGLAPLVAGNTAQAQEAFKAGTDYIALPRPVPGGVSAGKVEVIEFFSYNCPHCALFEPQLEAWSKKLPDDVNFTHVPVPFVGNDVQAKQKLYYTLEALGKVDAYQGKLFKLIHAERQPIFGDEAILAWAEKEPGLDGKRFANMYKSFTVAGKIKRAAQIQNAYQVVGVPAFGVAGRWYVDGELARSMGRALQIVDFLIGEARKKS